MNRRTLLRLTLLSPLLTPAAARAQVTALPLSPQDSAGVQQIQAYLNNISTLKAHFLQVAPDGAMSEGTVWMDRPGRMRFQYDPPAPFLLVAGGGVLTFEDKSIQQISQAPLSMTPLGILLADHINLNGPVTVVGFNRLPGQLQLKLVRNSSPRDGTLTLLFTDTPLTLRQWTVLDAQRRETTVTLYNVEQGVSLPNNLFHFVDPRTGQEMGGTGG
jgi:outer membrane lipoprotein-sorting protein